MELDSIVNIVITIISSVLGSGVVGGMLLWFLNRKKFNAEVVNTKALTKNTDALTENTDAQTANFMVEVATKVTKQVNEQNSELQEQLVELKKEIENLEIERKKDKESFEIRLSEAERKIEELEDENCSVNDWAAALVKQLEEAKLIPAPFKKKKKVRSKSIQEGKDG
jgi:flagellar basal body-associated protein FliL